MAAKALPILLLVVLQACDLDRKPDHVEKVMYPNLTGRIGEADVIDQDQLLTFDIIQRTCALYVTIRSSSLKSTPAFDREIDQTMVRWKCDESDRLACAR